MKLPRLWSYSLAVSMAVSAGCGLLWACLLLIFGWNMYAGTYAGSLGFGIVACLLIFAFMLELPRGNWRHRLLHEIFPAGFCAALIAAEPIVIILLVKIWDLSGLLTLNSGSGVRDFFYPLAFTLGLGVVSYSIVRAFGRLYAWWSRLRQRSLIWEIAHAQLRLVIVAAVALLAILIVLLLGRIGDLVFSDPANSIQLLTLLIEVVGLVGIVTGIVLLIVVVPAAILSYFSAQRITRRIDNLAVATTNLREGFYQTRVIVEGQDEVARLQTDFNAMAEIMERYVANLHAQRENVENLLESRRRLFAGVSHELRTPLSVISSYLEILQKKSNMPPDWQDYLQVMDEETHHLQHLINDLFTLARTESGQLEINIQPFQIESLLKRTVEAARLQGWQSKKLEIGLELSDCLPPVLADETRLEQILANLLRNAIRHTPPGGIIAVSVVPEQTNLAIYVRDTGEGISPQDLPYIWERFYRSAEARAADPGGAGLGLPLVRELTEAMQGHVQVESTPGEGTCFIVRLPISAQVSSQEPAQVVIMRQV